MSSWNRKQPRKAKTRSSAVPTRDCKWQRKQQSGRSTIPIRTAIDRICAYIKTTYLLSRDYNEREEAAFTATSRFVSPFTGRKRVPTGRDSRLIMKRIAAYKG